MTTIIMMTRETGITEDIYSDDNKKTPGDIREFFVL